MSGAKLKTIAGSLEVSIQGRPAIDRSLSHKSIPATEHAGQDISEHKKGVPTS